MSTFSKLPAARKFFIKYRKANGQIFSYRISAPIEETEDLFTAYAFGRGCRSFKRSGVIELRQI